MSGLQSLSIDLPAYFADEPSVAGPRAAGSGEAPVASPVHDLQEQLARLNATPTSENDLEPRHGRLPGWLRLSLPLAMSLMLWAGILWASGVARAVGLSE